MKPAFALDFRNDAITLLHRTPGGWHQIGRVAIDEPDLEAALAYMRSTAMGLSPRGIAAKLILPDDQILYTTVDAPGPDDASRTAQIRAALEGRTPYPVDDLVFDWEQQGDAVRVAVVARDTLTEAEAFAVEHRFNPVSFVAAPDASRFGSEPWFGQTDLSQGLLATGEKVDRDHSVVEVTGRSLEPDEPAPEPPQEPQVEPEPEVAPEPEVVPVEVPESQPEELPAAEPEVPPAVEPAPYDPEPPAPVAPPDWATAAPAAPTRVFALAEDDIPPSRAFAQNAAPEPEDLRDAAPEVSPPRATAPVDVAEDVAEAPMALDVEETDTADSPLVNGKAPRSVIAPEIDPDVADDVPPMPGYSPAMGFASRRAGTDPAGAKTPPPVRSPGVDRPAAARPLPGGAPKADRPMVGRAPVGKQGPVTKDSKGLRGLGALVTAPGIAGSRKKKVTIPVAPQPDVPVAAAPPAAAKPATPARNGLGGLSSRPAPVRGKPRYLGLALTALLLLALAIIAAWSTSLAFRTPDDSTVQTAEAAGTVVDAEVPAPEDEMLADLQDPEALNTEEQDATQLDTAALDAAPLDAAEPAPTDTAAGAPAADAPVAETPVAEAPQDEAAAPTAGTETAAAPGMNSGDDPQDEIFLATLDRAPEAPDALALPAAADKGDPLPAAQAPPPPFGTVYKFDANGLIVPTPEGIITPEGVRLVAGKPPRVPTTRPETVVAAAAAASAASTSAPSAAPASAAPAPPVADPALSGFRPKPRPEGLAPAPATTDDASLAPAADSRFASLRPKARPQAVVAAGEAARDASAAASLAAQAEAAAAADAAGPASPLAVAISRRPAARPRDLSRAVEAAVAAAVRTPEPEPTPEPAPEPKAEKAPTANAKATEPEADDEPETASAAPRVKQNASVAKQATFKNAINLGKTALIGVYGTPSKRYAMIRTEGGRYKKVKVGDKVDGGRIQAITATEIRYQKGSRLVTLAMPKG